MALPSSGTITAAMINKELGRAENAPFNLNDSAVRSLAGKPSGTISFSDFWGKSNIPPFVFDPSRITFVDSFFELMLGGAGEYDDWAFGDYSGSFRPPGIYNLTGIGFEFRARFSGAGVSGSPTTYVFQEYNLQPAAKNFDTWYTAAPYRNQGDGHYFSYGDYKGSGTVDFYLDIRHAGSSDIATLAIPLRA